MPKINQLVPFLTGLGIGIGASFLLAPDAGSETRGRLRQMARRAGDAVKEQADHLSGAAVDVLQDSKQGVTDEVDKGSQAMSDAKQKAKKKIDEAADATKKTAEDIVDTSKDVAHSAGKKMEEGGKRLQSA